MMTHLKFRKSTPCAWIKSGSLIGVLGFLYASSAIAQAPNCSCRDRNDLLNRFAEAKAAVGEYKHQITLHGSKKFTDDIFHSTIQPSVQIAINAVTRRGVNKLSGGVHPGTCQRLPNRATAGRLTACLEASADKHEGVHGRVCDAWKTARLPLINNYTDYRGGMTVAQALEEEIGAYGDEMTFIKNELNANCPLGWTLAFDVTVSGRGNQPSGQEGAVNWRIHHKYSGSIDLTQGTPVMGAAEMALLANAVPQGPQAIAAARAKIDAHRRWTPMTFSIPLSVEVDDEIVNSSTEFGEATSFEKTTTTRTWKGAGNDSTTGTGFLDLDENNLIHDIEFTIQPNDVNRQVTRNEKNDITRSAYGWGNKPTHESNPGANSLVPFKDLRIPVDVPKINGRVIKYTKQPLKEIQASFAFSDKFTLATAYLTGLPKSAVNVDVQYRLTRIEPK